ncbi:hypothetical protein HELRODRAFT_172738 [Helobdella robusta]|uniref:Uncharacterized protein n=1 Tax=Helobdella robusta TaxID=6412 RepID=T1F5W2_HELRO|nr:hypothetical protein HELRODRAFT_172738 [Helobdella robusta]ESO04372.1 hypothetical protein HELRODRAFT_172738 [Helobdella robusta]
MAMATFSSFKRCLNSTNSFCHICGRNVPQNICNQYLHEVLRPVPHEDDIPVRIPIVIAKVLPNDESIDSLVYCSNIPGLITELGVMYDANKRKNFIDSSKRCFKAVLLHTGNIYASVPIAYFIQLKETNDNMGVFHEKHKCKHKWLISGDIKIIIGIILRGEEVILNFHVFYVSWIAGQIKITCKWNVNTMTEYCWMLKRENLTAKEYGRKSRRSLCP